MAKKENVKKKRPEAKLATCATGAGTAAAPQPLLERALETLNGLSYRQRDMLQGLREHQERFMGDNMSAVCETPPSSNATDCGSPMSRLSELLSELHDQHEEIESQLREYSRIL